MTSCNEQWRDVPGFEGAYQVSNLGRIHSSKRGLLKPFTTRQGYQVATLQKEGQRVRTGVHRLVGLAFIPNPENKEDINHIDGNKQNNNVENLEWATRSENNLHRCRVLRAKCGRDKRPVICLDTGTVYGSITEASRATGAQLPKIVLCCQGKRLRTGGLRWAYKEG